VVARKAWMMGMAGALVATAALVAPAMGAAGDPAQRNVRRAAGRAAGAFTPAAADPRLAALFARGGFDSSSFRFTPAEAGRAPRGVSLAVRARTARGIELPRVTAPAANVGVAPIAYSLGASLGWKRVTIAGDVSRVDLAQQPGGREMADVAVTYRGGRLSGRVKGLVERPITNIATLPGDGDSYSLDASTSYSLTRNLDVTAGLRYRTDRERLARTTDDRRESQAVYVGTAFRF
jgi:hypothetical protein